MKSKKKKVNEKNKTSGITLIALIITIIVLLILAGVALASLTGENGLLGRSKQAKEKAVKSEMKEQLELAIYDLQIEKEGNATLNDITQEWAKNKLEKYKPELTDDASINGKRIKMKKNGVTGRYIIDGNLNVIEVEYDGTIDFSYEVGKMQEEKVKIKIKVQDEENGIKTIQIQDEERQGNGSKDEIQIDYEVELGKEYKIKIIASNGEEREETIKIENYYYNVSMEIAEGVQIDNKATKVEYNKPYTAKLTANENYIIDTITVTMGEQEVKTVNKETGEINIEKVIGDIKITATVKKLEIIVTDPIIATTKTASSSVNENSQTIGTKLYINFSATIENKNCTINPEVPFEVTKNGTYEFTITGIYNEKTITKEIEVVVRQYKGPVEVVQYDAGDWSKEEIKELQKLSLYDINIYKSSNSTIKLNNPTGLNLTFGGFTYKDDIENENHINAGTIVTSRNQGISPKSGYGTTFDGWTILEKEERNGKVYVKKIIHAGSPENFVFHRTSGASGNAYRAEYILSLGQRQTNYNTLSTGETINVRNWDMYKDKTLESKGYINNVHIMDYTERSRASSAAVHTGGSYWVSSASSSTNLYLNWNSGDQIVAPQAEGAFGIRPVIEMNEGVYISSGSGTDEDPYILAKE